MTNVFFLFTWKIMICKKLWKVKHLLMKRCHLNANLNANLQNPHRHFHLPHGTKTKDVEHLDAFSCSSIRVFAMFWMLVERLGKVQRRTHPMQRRETRYRSHSRGRGSAVLLPLCFLPVNVLKPSMCMLLLNQRVFHHHMECALLVLRLRFHPCLRCHRQRWGPGRPSQPGACLRQSSRSQRLPPSLQLPTLVT